MIRKITRPFSLLLLSVTIFFISCDNINTPVQPKIAVNSGEECPDEIFSSNSNPIRKILVEDYTGHTCGNCPAAALIIQNSILPVHADQVIPIAVHAGATFAKPLSAPYASDFRTSAGDNYDSFFGISALGNPNGMINRIHYNSSSKTHVKSKEKWVALCDSLTQVDPVADIQIKNVYDNSTQKVCIHIETTFLTNLNGKYNLVVLLVQDSIVDAQKNYTASPTDVLNYTHRHVLRDPINGADGNGEEIIGDTTNIINGKTVYKKYQYEIAASYKNIACDINQCYVVAFVYNTSTYEVIQAEEKKIK